MIPAKDGRPGGRDDALEQGVRATGYVRDGAGQEAPQCLRDIVWRFNPLIDRMRQAQAKMTEQARHNWDAMVEKTHAMTDRMRTAMNTQGSSMSVVDHSASATGAAGATSSATRASTSATTTDPALTAPPSLGGGSSRASKRRGRRRRAIPAERGP